MKKTIAFAAVWLMLLFSFAGCGSPAASDQEAGETEQKDSVIIVMGPSSEPEAGFDPIYGWGAGEHVHEPLIQSTLTVTTNDLQIGYDLAIDIFVSNDGLLWTVQIREDVSFTDGEKLTAEDVAFTYNTAKAGSSVNDFTMLDKAEAVDDFTVKFHMAKPFSIWPYTMATVGIVPAHAYGPDYGQRPIGSGRYILKQWDKGQQALLEANPLYYGDEILMKHVTILFMDEATAFAAAKAGQVDLTYTAASYSDETLPGYRLLSFETVDNRGFSLPSVPSNGDIGSNGEIGNDVTADPAIRQAINMGINRQQMIDNVLNGYGTAAYSVCDKMPWFNPDTVVEYDLDGAAALLENAGWVAGEDGVRVRLKDGLKAEVNILYPAGDSVRQALAADARNQIRNLGIHATVEGVGWDTAYARAQRDIMTWGWGAHTPMEFYNIYHTLPETGLARYSPYANRTVDSYMDQALAASDLEESWDLWRKAQWDGNTGVAEDVPWVWLLNVDHLYWSRENLVVAEQKIHPHGHGWSIVNNVDRWSWK